MSFCNRRCRSVALMTHDLAPRGQLRPYSSDGRVTDLLFNGERLFAMLDRLNTLAKLVQRQTNIPQRMSFPSAVATFANDR